VLDIALARDDAGLVIFVDDDDARDRSVFCGYRVIAASRILREPQGLAGAPFVIAIGDNQLRARRFETALKGLGTAATLVHPSAVVSPDARVGAGTVILPRAVINAGAEIGRNCIINTAAVVEHDCRIGDHVHVSPAATLGGGVVIEPLAQIGIGATVLPGVHIGMETIIGGGCLVIRDAPPHATLIGVPARVLRRH
jgi:sugar O-acyltransferase (sialic acid O-acetyltransferase NeuD family)